MGIGDQVTQSPTKRKPSDHMYVVGRPSCFTIMLLLLGRCQPIRGGVVAFFVFVHGVFFLAVVEDDLVYFDVTDVVVAGLNKQIGRIW